jgi:hypothetical protein
VDEEDVPDLSGAEVYVEAAERTITGGGRWYVLPGDRVIYRRPNGQFELNPVIGSADTLRSSATWKRLPSDDAGTV